jgi:hypothetical protein
MYVLAGALEAHLGARDAFTGAEYWRLLLDWNTRAGAVEDHRALIGACLEHPYQMIKILLSDESHGSRCFDAFLGGTL